MNRQVFIYLTLAAITIAAVFTSCQKDDNVKVKLLETVTYPYGSYDKFKYDIQNRLTIYSRYDSSGELLETRTLTYSGNDLANSVFNSAFLYEYTKSGNIITSIINSENTHMWDLNSDRQLVKYVGKIVGNSQIIDYQYQNGNIVKYTYAYTYAEGGTFETFNEYKYDNEKSPMYNCTTPQWYLIYSFKDISTTNNMTEEKWIVFPNTGGGPYEDVYEYIYEYDKDGYPTKRTKTDNNGSREVTEYAYKVL